MIQDGRWSKEQDAQLTKLWSDGLSSTNIAIAMGLYSRMQVIGRAHRLDLPRRPNPTKHKVSKPKLRVIKMKPAVPLQVPIARVTAVQIPMRLHPVHKCRWPTSDDRPWTFCEQPAVVGKSYCECHWLRSIQPKLQAAE